MKTVALKGKNYKEFELPDEGMFFNKGTIGIAWNWDNGKDARKYELELIYPHNFDHAYRVKTKENYGFMHCALLSDEIIDVIHHPTVEDVRHGCFVKVIKSTKLGLKHLIFLADRLGKFNSTDEIGVCVGNDNVISLDCLQFICYVEDFKLKKNNQK